MKRLTKRDSRGIPEIKGISESQRLCPKDRVLILDGVDRLAAYEDTGLEPETVGDLLERFNDLYAIFDDLDLVDRVHFQAFFDKVKLWHQAEKVGRLVVLPCKVGDLLYALARNTVSTFICTSVELLGDNRLWINWVLEDGMIGEFRFDGVNASDIGKTVFLTQQEAEEALRKEAEQG